MQPGKKDDSKKVYGTPELIVYGPLSTLTQNAPELTGNVDNQSPSMDRKTT